MNEDKYNVRITFKHGNAITLDCKGCGQVYLAPNHDYFFENAPMQFINYLPQLKRLGVSYRIINDKRGCYQTFNLSNYFANDPFKLMGQLRSTRTNVATPIVEEVKEEEIIEEPVIETPVTQTVEIPDVVKEPPVKTTEDTDLKEDQNEGTPETTQEDLKEDPTPVVSSEPEQVSQEDLKEDPVVETPEEIDIEHMSKPKLIEYAKNLGLTQVTDYWTKKEIREAITNKLSE